MTMQLIHYGSDYFNPNKFIEPYDHLYPYIKPSRGGLWTSPINSIYGWQQWCDINDFGDLSKYFTLEYTGNTFVIDRLEDCKLLPWVTDTGFSFQALIKSGYDAIHLTAKGERETRMPKSPTFKYSLYGWDCETVLILNPDTIIQTKGSDLIEHCSNACVCGNNLEL